MIRFMNARAVVRRIRDGIKLYGWVFESRNPGQIQIKITKGDIQFVQEPYEVTLSSRLGGLVAKCMLGAVDGDCATFAMPTVVEIIPPPVSWRIKTPRYDVQIAFSGKTVAGKLLDIANNGIGVCVQEAVPKGTAAYVEIISPYGRRAVDAVCAYCRDAEGMSPGWHRAGFRVDAESRLSQANWKYIFDCVVEQTILEVRRHSHDGGPSSQGIAACRQAFNDG